MSIFITTHAHTPCDTVILRRPHTPADPRYEYQWKILKAALEITKPQYGQYCLEYASIVMKRDRALMEMEKGITVNVTISPPRPEWIEKTHTIFFPVRKGIGSFRLFLTMSDSDSLFHFNTTLEELKKLRCGVQQQWTTAKAMAKLDFTLVHSTNYPGLFGMLADKRFDYLPRGVNEIYEEHETWSQIHPEMVIENELVLLLPLPTFIFISKTEPELAERIEKGLSLIVENGTFEKIFTQHFETFLKKADIDNRKMIVVENPLLQNRPYMDNPKIWIPAKYLQTD